MEHNLKGVLMGVDLLGLDIKGLESNHLCLWDGVLWSWIWVGWLKIFIWFGLDGGVYTRDRVVFFFVGGEEEDLFLLLLSIAGITSYECIMIPQSSYPSPCACCEYFLRP